MMGSLSVDTLTCMMGRLSVDTLTCMMGRLPRIRDMKGWRIRVRVRFRVRVRLPRIGIWKVV